MQHLCVQKTSQINGTDEKKGTLQFKEKSCIPEYHPKHQPKGDLNLPLHDPKL
jgi:hypothetical protein